ncbi:GntR family transcriptional regulator [Roseburia hominis]
MNKIAPIKKKHQSLSEMTTEALINLIMDGTLKMGEKLTLDEVATSLGVSQTPVREAFKTLTRMGLIVSEPYVGVHVASLDEKDVKEIYLGRKALEPLLAYHACANITAEKLAEIEEIQQKLLETCTMESYDARQLFKYNKEFHFAIYRESGLPKLTEMAESLWNSLAFYKLTYGKHHSNDSTTAFYIIKDHEVFLKALREQNPQMLYDSLYESLDRHERTIPEDLTVLAKKKENE